VTEGESRGLIQQPLLRLACDREGRCIRGGTIATEVEKRRVAIAIRSFVVCEAFSDFVAASRPVLIRHHTSPYVSIRQLRF
jgi:hypothetical protein